MRAILSLALAAVVACLSTGCIFSEYSPGAIVAQHPPNATRQLGSLDVAFSLGRDFARIGYDSLLLTIDVGNREARPCAFDLGAVEIAGRTDDGSIVPLHFYDPRREITPRHLDALSSVRIYVRVDGGVAPSHVAAVCFDVRALAPDHPRASPDDICFARTDEGFVAVDAIGGAR